MASRDKIPGRSMKVLSREEHGGGGEGNGDRRRRDRDSRRREDRDKRRDNNERDAADKPVQGPIVLLKRPDVKNSGGSSSSTTSIIESGATTDNTLSSSSKSFSAGAPTLILQRSLKKEAEGGEQPTPEKVKTNGPSVTELLKGPYEFPGGQTMTLIDSKMKICPWRMFDYDLNNYTGNMDYLVITAIGRPNVGKSSILSYLAGDDIKFGARRAFPPRSREEEMHTSIYISKNQVVFIELSSAFSQAATNELIPLVSQQGVLEVSNMTWNLRLVRWALSVSHVILVVSENVFEPSLFQLLNSAEIVHTMDSALGEGSYPEPIYVYNKTNLELLDNSEVTAQFQDYFTSVTGRTPRVETNYYLLPHTKYEMEHYRFEHFKQSVMEFNRYNRAPFAKDKDGLVKLSQKVNIQEWYQNSLRVWEEMSTPSYFSSYIKLLP